jgi:hypothetical protein
MAQCSGSFRRRTLHRPLAMQTGGHTSPIVLRGSGRASAAVSSAQTGSLRASCRVAAAFCTLGLATASMAAGQCFGRGQGCGCCRHQSPPPKEGCTLAMLRHAAPRCTRDPSSARLLTCGPLLQHSGTCPCAVWQCHCSIWCSFKDQWLLCACFTRLSCHSMHLSCIHSGRWRAQNPIAQAHCSTLSACKLRHLCRQRGRSPGVLQVSRRRTCYLLRMLCMLPGVLCMWGCTGV